MCDTKYIRSCAAPIFENMLKKCGEAKKVIKKFRKITWELSRLAIAGDGDRNCIFRPNLVPCNMLKFSKNDPKVVFFNIDMIGYFQSSGFRSTNSGSLRRNVSKMWQTRQNSKDDY